MSLPADLLKQLCPLVEGEFTPKIGMMRADAQWTGINGRYLEIRDDDQDVPDACHDLKQRLIAKGISIRLTHSPVGVSVGYWSDVNNREEQMKFLNKLVYPTELEAIVRLFVAVGGAE
jgi:hypothetical protein